MCANLELYNKIKSVPSEAKKPIGAGRLKGKTDINPMWRIKMLTQHFGICGIGWKTEIVRAWLEQGANNEQTANVHIHLYVKDPETKEWSAPIVGIGGAAFVASEKGGYFTDDDCYKKAYTDAISIACKALGMAADVYYEKDPDSKYQQSDSSSGQQAPVPGLPFPEVRALPSYEQALNTSVVHGGFCGTLKDLYKVNRAAIGEIYQDPRTTAELRDAISVIEAEIVKHNAR